MGLHSSGQVENNGSGTIGALNGAVTVPVPAAASFSFTLSGTWVATLIFEASNDGTTFFTIPAVSLPTLALATTATTNATYGINVGGFLQVRVRASLYTSGTATVTWNSDSTDGVLLAPRILAGGTDGAVIGNVSDSLKVMTLHTDTVPATQTITALDVGTSSLVGANGQVFYFGTPTTNSAATFALAGMAMVSIQGSLLGAGGTMVVETTIDGGTFWNRPTVFQPGTQTYSSSGFTSPFVAILNVAGCTHVRVRGTVSWTGTGTILVTETVNDKAVIITDSLPGGANNIGSITNVTGTVSLPTGASTAANQTTEITSLQLIDDVPSAQNAAFVKGAPIMGQLDDTSTTVATEDNVAVARITAQRALHTNLRNVAGTEIATSGAPLRIDPTGTTTQPVSDGGGSLTVDGTVTATQGGAPWSENITQIGGSSLTLGQKTSANSIPVVLPSDETFPVTISPSAITTYSAAISNLVVAALATDILTISGSATTVVRVTNITVTATGSAGANANLTLVRRSTANTGGTSTTPTVIPYDSNDAAGTAVVRAYTVNPTLGTTVGTVRSIKQFVSGVVTAGPGIVQWEFGVRPAKPIVLRGVAQSLALNLVGVTITGGSYDIDVEWTEAAT